MSGDYENIRQLYIEKLTGMISPADEFRLQVLIEKDEDNKLFFESLVKEKEELNVDLFIEKLNARKELAEVKRLIRLRKINYGWLSAAAAILIIMSIGLWNWLSKEQALTVEKGQVVSVTDNGHVQLFVEGEESVTLNSNRDSTISVGDLKFNTSGNSIKSIEGKTSVAFNTLVVPAKLDYQITLSDGTKVFLNSASKLRFPSQFSGKTREIYVEGEAYLEVAKNKTKPFIVHTENADIKVLGTSFNINTYEPGNIKTALVEGAVLLTAKNDGKSIQLTPGFLADYHVKNGFKTWQFEAEEVLSWRNGIHYFQNLSLKELSPVVSRWFDMQLAFNSDKYDTLTVSGLIEKGKLKEFLNDLTSSGDISYQIVGDQIQFR